MSSLKRPRSQSGAVDYEIGYGRPPKHTRFVPGRSGNAMGRPKSSRNFATEVKDALKSPVRITRDGKSRTISTLRAALLRLKEKALTGDARALDRVLHLAEVYGSEEAAVADVLTADDAAVVEVFKQRLLSGAAAVDGIDNRPKVDHPRASSAAVSPATQCPDRGSGPTESRQRGKSQRTP
jgi:hypothetical protein